MEPKPSPLNRKKFIKNLPDFYQIPEQVLQPYNNGEEDPTFRKHKDIDNLRANNISTKNTQIQNIKIGLVDIDSSILYHLKNNIIPQVQIHGNLIEIPIIYASPERWKSIQKDGYYRDKNGKIQSPLIVIKRDYFSKDRTLGNKLDGNNVNNVQYFKKGWSKRNSYDNLRILQNQKPQEEYQVTVIPDYINIKYSLIIFTDFIEHNNDIIESIAYASDSYWGDKERFQFRSFINDFPTPVDVEINNDRISRSEISLNVKGYIIPNNINVNLSTPSKLSFNKSKIIIEEKTIENNIPKEFKPLEYIKPPCDNSINLPYIKYISGTENIIPLSEHSINPISSIEVYDSNDIKIHIQIINNDGLVSILSNVPLNNHKLIIS